MPRFAVATYLMDIKGSYSDFDVVYAPTGMDEVNYHGSYGTQHIILTKKDAGYYPNHQGDMVSFIHARNAISPGWSDSTRRMLAYHNSYAVSEQLELDSPIFALCSNLHRASESFIFDNMVRDGDTVLMKYDFSLKTVWEYNANGSEQTTYNFYFPEYVRIAGGWIDAGKNLWDMFYLTNTIIYNRFNPLIEYPYFNLHYTPIGSVIANTKSTYNTCIQIGSFNIKFDRPKFLIKDPSTGNIYNVNTNNGTLNDISGSVDLTTYSGFMSSANPFDDFFVIDMDEFNNLMTNNDYLEFICNCRVPHFITKFDAFNLGSNEYLYFRVQQYKTWSIKDVI